MNDLNRTVQLVCPVCGCKTFHYDNENPNTSYTCLQCHKVFTKEELQDGNQEILDVNMDELKKQAAVSIQNEIKDMFKKTFKDSKGIHWEIK
jgi:transcription initiation factor TFIIIB Brf1 subunit/transcription initiation factor TFIIB